MNHFDRVMAFILAEEGGYVNNPADPGGETKYGISKRAYPNLNIAALTVEDAKSIYRRDYWNVLGLDTVAKYGPALVLMNCAVNAGVRRALQIKERVSTSSQPFIVAFQAELMLHYASLPTWSVFGRGWARRTIRASIEAGKNL